MKAAPSAPADQQPAPAFDAQQLLFGHQPGPEQRGDRHPEEAEGVRVGDVPAADRARQELGEIGVDEDQFGAEAEAGEEAQRQQPLQVRGERAQQGEQRVRAQIHHEHPAPPEAVGEHRQHIGADEHAEESRGDHPGLPGVPEMPLLGQDRAEHAAEKDLVEVEEGTDADDERDPAVPSGRRQPVEPRRGASADGGSPAPVRRGGDGVRHGGPPLSRSHAQGGATPHRASGVPRGRYPSKISYRKGAWAGVLRAARFRRGHRPVVTMPGSTERSGRGSA